MSTLCQPAHQPVMQPLLQTSVAADALALTGGLDACRTITLDERLGLEAGELGDRPEPREQAQDLADERER